MKLRELTRCAGLNQVAFAIAYPLLVRPFYKLTFMASALGSGLLGVLSRGPATIDDLRRQFVRREQDGEAFAQWLGIGRDLGILAYSRKGYRLRGILPRLLSLEATAPLGAMLREIASMHHKLLLDLPARLAQGRPYRLEDHDGVVTAGSSRMMEPLIYNALDRLLPPSGPFSLLDVGCGAGTYLAYAAGRNPLLHALGVELPGEVAELAKRNVQAWGLSGSVRVLAADIRDLGPRGEYDLVTLHNNVYYFPLAERLGVLRHVRGHLKPGGRLLVTTACDGGTIAARMEGLWSSFTEGCGRYPAVPELLDQLREAGYASVASRRLVLGEQYYSFEGENPRETPAKA